MADQSKLVALMRAAPPVDTYQAELAAITQRRKMAEMLSQESADDQLPVFQSKFGPARISPLSFASNALGAVMGQKRQYDAIQDAKQNALNQQNAYRVDIDNITQGLQPQDATPAMPANVPTNQAQADYDLQRSMATGAIQDVRRLQALTQRTPEQDAELTSAQGREFNTPFPEGVRPDVLGPIQPAQLAKAQKLAGMLNPELLTKMTTPQGFESAKNIILQNMQQQQLLQAFGMPGGSPGIGVGRPTPAPTPALLPGNGRGASGIQPEPQAFAPSPANASAQGNQLTPQAVQPSTALPQNMSAIPPEIQQGMRALMASGDIDEAAKYYAQYQESVAASRRKGTYHLDSNGRGVFVSESGENRFVDNLPPVFGQPNTQNGLSGQTNTVTGKFEQFVEPPPVNVTYADGSQAVIPYRDYVKQFGSSAQNNSAGTLTQPVRSAASNSPSSALLQTENNIPRSPSLATQSLTKELSAETAKNLYISREKVADMTQFSNNIDKAIRLLPTAGTFMGPAGGLKREAINFLNNNLGLDINIEGITDSGELKSRLFQAIEKRLKAMDATPTGEQQRLMQEAFGRIGDDPRAVEAILRAMYDAEVTRVGVHNDRINSLEKRSGVRTPEDMHITIPNIVASVQWPDPDDIPENKKVTASDGSTWIKRHGKIYQLGFAPVKRN